jgi:bacillithiol biosynthesis cysteine-adding enzyme BshC
LELQDKTKLDAKEYGKFSGLIQDYLAQNSSVQEFYHLFPSEDNLLRQTQEKLTQYAHRETLHKALSNQLSDLELSSKQRENLDKLRLSNTVTITTGHQLNLLTGPLYFFHKILQTIKSCEEMSRHHSEFNFVPIFWMATEDHDFEEINHFYYKSQKFQWLKSAGGPVGRMNLDGIQDVFHRFFECLPDSKNAKALKELIENSYLNSNTLTEASRKLVQSLFSEWGLLMIDGDDAELKKLMIPRMEEDLIQNTAFQKVGETIEKFEEHLYSAQVNPREINLFYVGQENLRERIIFEDNLFKVLHSDLAFSKDEILAELQAKPENFSPNVILRPVYQETILPNIAYIGGTGEMAYWLELKSFFDSQNLLFPQLIVRNSVLILNEKQKSKLEKLTISYSDLFLPLYQLVNKNIEENSDVEIDFNGYESQLEQIFKELEEKATQTDSSFSKMVQAQRKKQLDGLAKMKSRLTKAEKRKHSERVERIEILYAELFPNGNLQERISNFSEFYLEYGVDFVKEVYEIIEPIDFRFSIKTLP